MINKWTGYAVFATVFVMLGFIFAYLLSDTQDMELLKPLVISFLVAQGCTMAYYTDPDDDRELKVNIQNSKRRKKMTKYSVDYDVFGKCHITVFAEDKQEARELSMEIAADSFIGNDVVEDLEFVETDIDWEPEDNYSPVGYWEESH